MAVDNILSLVEVESFTNAIKPSKIGDIGSVAWFDGHFRLERLRQQAIVEAANYVEEKVKDILIVQEKIPVLIYEAILIQIWREKVWKKISEHNVKLLHGFIGYMILYHESVVINLIQIILHHEDSIQSLGDESLDLIDYCSSQVIQISTTIHHPDRLGEDDVQRLSSDQKDIQLNIGLTSVAIFSSLSEFLSELNISVINRLYATHDVPLLLTNLLEIRPWIRSNNNTKTMEVFNDGAWVSWDSEAICKSEAQCWLALRGFLLHECAKQHYEISEFRKRHLVKMMKYLHEGIIDQISPLIELKIYLSNLSVWAAPPTKTPIMIEAVPEIRTTLLSKGKDWKKLTKRLIDLMVDGNRDEVIEIAKRVAETYDADVMAKVPIQPNTTHKCELCGKEAFKRCSACHDVWYCGRECQVRGWPNHKAFCATK